MKTAAVSCAIVALSLACPAMADWGDLYYSDAYDCIEFDLAPTMVDSTDTLAGWDWHPPAPPNPVIHDAGTMFDPEYEFPIKIPPLKCVTWGLENDYRPLEKTFWFSIRYKGPGTPQVPLPACGYHKARGEKEAKVRELQRIDVGIGGGKRKLLVKFSIDPQPDWEVIVAHAAPPSDGRTSTEIDSVYIWSECGPTPVESTSWGLIKALFK